jgi:hypothetical protein
MVEREIHQDHEEKKTLVSAENSSLKSGYGCWKDRIFL